MSVFFELEKENTILCKACARYCSILEQDVGYCGVRYNNGKEIEVLNYSKFIFLKKDGKDLCVGGIGSNMRLSFDMDWDTSLLPYLNAKEFGRSKTTDLIKKLGYEFTPEELVSYAQKQRCEKIVFQFNEPLVFLEYVLSIARMKKIKVGLVSTGYFSMEFFTFVLPFISEIDIVFYSTFDKFYFKHGRVQLRIIKENIAKLYSEGSVFRIICPLIEDENDSDEEIKGIVAFISELSRDIPIVFKRYYPSYRMVDKSVTTDDVLRNAKDIALQMGLQNVILD